MLPHASILKLLPAFKRQFFTADPVYLHARQWARERNKKPLEGEDGKVRVEWDDRRALRVPLSDTHLIDHFTARPLYAPKVRVNENGLTYSVPAVYGSYGYVLLLKNDVVKMMGWDGDSQADVDLVKNHLLPQFYKYDIDFIEEYSGVDNDRGHWWISTEGIEKKYTDALFNQFRMNADLPVKEWLKEQYPYGPRANSIFRIPFGIHLKSMEVKWGNKNGTEFDNLEDGLNAFGSLKPLTQDKLLSLLKETPKERKVYALPEKVILASDSVTRAAPLLDLPPWPDKISRKCPAIHRFLTESPELVNIKGGSHTPGLYFAGLMQKNDIVLGTKDGEAYFQAFMEENRDRGHRKHNWTYYWGKLKKSQRLIPSCKTWEEAFDWCGGCPYRGKIGNPSRLFYAEEIRRTKVGDIRVASLEDIRKEVFPLMNQMVDDHIAKGRRLDLVIDSVQNSGKCFGIDTPILMFDGRIKPVQDVKVGDLVMGPDSQPRLVKNLARGREMLYHVMPAKGSKGFICNESHTLSLKSNRKADYGTIVNIGLKDYLASHERYKRKFKYYRSELVDFEPPTESLAIDPYTLGLWLGDGNSKRMEITNVDPEIIISLRDEFRTRGYGLVCTANTVSACNNFRPKTSFKGLPSSYAYDLRHYNLTNNKHIPYDYKIATAEDRWQLLAGLIDSDGSLGHSGMFEVTFKNQILAEDTAFIARSLGLCVSIHPKEGSCVYKGEKRTGQYYRLHISGDTWNIPTKLRRKQSHFRAKRPGLMSGFTITKLEEGNYYGFTVEGPDHLFLLGDFTVVHNSFAADDLAVRLAKQGLRVCIACNSSKVALQHKERINAAGSEAFFMGSYEAVFEHFNPANITCPKSVEIMDYRSLGIDASVYKERFCKKCKFYDDCAYPRQYTQVQEDKYPIVIIQHAHFGSEEVTRQLFKKDFDVLIVDENFIDQLITQIIPTADELEILKENEKALPWLTSLVKWLEGGIYAVGTIKPSRNDLRPLLEAFKARKVTYRVDQFIRQFNDGNFLHPTIGIMKFLPLPDVPIRLFLDATADIKEIEIVLNNPDVVTIGRGVVTDSSVYHPRNKVYQVLDGRASKAEMITREKLYEYLEVIGDKMLNEYSDLTGLITVFKEAEQDAFEWLLRNYPTIIPRIAINHMAVGTNEFAKYNVQFILAGPYVNLKMLRQEVFKLKFIINYWNKKEERTLINNPYPAIEDNAKSRDFISVPVQMNHRDGVYQYDQFTRLIPSDYHEQMVFKRLQGKKAQAGRIRQEMGKVTIFFFCDSDTAAGFLIDGVVQESELLSAVRSISGEE